MLRRLAGQTAIYGVSSIIARLLNYLLTPYLTRIFTTAEYGVVTDMYALIPFALVVLTLGLETGYFRFAGQAEGDEGKRKVFATTWSATLLAATLFLGCVMLFRNPIGEAMGYAAHPEYIWTVALIVFLDVASAIPFARLRQQNRAGMYVLLRVVSVVVNVALCVLLLSGLPSLTPDVGYVFTANLVASAVVFLWLLQTLGRDIRIFPYIDNALARKVLLYSMPLLISGIAGTANEFIDRQLIKYLLPADISMSSLGIYGGVVKIAVVMMLFTQMYRLAAEPFFLSGMKNEDFKSVTAVATKYYIIVSLLIFLGITLFADLFALIVGADFREGIYILPVILASYVFHGITFNLSFWYKQSGQTKYAIWVTGAGLVVTIVASIALIPVLGYAGAAWAGLLCSVVTTVISYLLNQRHYPIPYDVRSIGIYFLACGALYGLSFATGLLPAIPKYILNFAIVAAFALWAVRREGIDIKSILRR